MVKFIPLSIPNFEGNERKYVDDAIDQGWVSTGGAYITKLEKNMAEFLHTDNVAACQSGTSALHLSLVEAGVKPGDVVYDNASPLFELLSKSYLHITVSSTTLYEAALFGCPTVCLKFGDKNLKRTYGFEVWGAETADEATQLLKRCFDREQYEKYLGYLTKETMRYM